MMPSSPPERFDRLHSSPERPREARERLILALDFPSGRRALDFLSDLRQRTEQPPRWVKVGLELFLAEGASFVHLLREQGYSIFLDLKLHDIPNTVASAIRSLAPLEVDLLTIHGVGSRSMLSAAAEAAAGLSRPPRLLAVTVLTSMKAEDLRSIGVAGTPTEQVLRLARMAAEAGVHGLVASPLETAMLRSHLHSSGQRGEIHVVTPGIRPAGQSGSDDQQRIATPAAALRAGASQLVIGRPITQAADPAAAYATILAEMNHALEA